MMDVEMQLLKVKWSFLLLWLVIYFDCLSTNWENVFLIGDFSAMCYRDQVNGVSDLNYDSPMAYLSFLFCCLSWSILVALSCLKLFKYVEVWKNFGWIEEYHSYYNLIVCMIKSSGAWYHWLLFLYLSEGSFKCYQ